MLVGQVVETHFDFDDVLDVEMDAIPQNFDIDQVDVVTESELAEMAEGGLVVPIDPLLGDRTNPDYTETTITTYDRIELNGVQDIDMRILLPGESR